MGGALLTEDSQSDKFPPAEGRVCARRQAGVLFFASFFSCRLAILARCKN